MSGSFAMATTAAPIDVASATLDPFADAGLPSVGGSAAGPPGAEGGKTNALSSRPSVEDRASGAGTLDDSGSGAVRSVDSASAQAPPTSGENGANGATGVDDTESEQPVPPVRAPTPPRPRPFDPFAMLTTPSADRLPDPFVPIKSESDGMAPSPFALNGVSPFTGAPMPHTGSVQQTGHESMQNGTQSAISHVLTGPSPAPKWRESIDDDSVLWLPEPDPILTGRKPPKPRASLTGPEGSLSTDARVKVEGETRKRKADADGGSGPSTPIPYKKRGRPSNAERAARAAMLASGEIKVEVRVPRKRGRPSKADLEARAAALAAESLDGDGDGDVDVDGESVGGREGDGVDYDALDDDDELEVEEGTEEAIIEGGHDDEDIPAPAQPPPRKGKPVKPVSERPKRQRQVVNTVPSSPSSRGAISLSPSPSPSCSRSRSAPPAESSSSPPAQPPTSKSRTKTGRTGRTAGARRQPTAASGAEASPEAEAEADIDPNAPTATLSPQGYPNSITVPYNEHAVYTFFRYCAERHKMWVRKGQGVPRAEQTEDECMRNSFVGNVFRELDPVGKKDRGVVWGDGELTVEELCFRSFLFTGFYLETTYQALVTGLGEIPSWKKFNLEKYEAILHQYHFVEGNKIYYSGFQMVPPKLLFGREMPSYSATLRLVKSMMEIGLPARLAQCCYAVDASEAIQTIPTFGGFLSLCLITFLQEMTDELKFYYRNFASCGPGSRGYLQRIFGEHVIHNKAMELAGLTWLYENQWRYWARLGEDPPHAHELGLRPGLRVLDIENALCWCYKYTSNAAKYPSLADLPPPDFAAEADEAGPPASCDEWQNVASASRPAYAGDYEEEQAKLGKLAAADLAALDLKKNGEDASGKGKSKAESEEEEEEWYEVEKIINRMGDRAKRNGRFRVRWKGYPPEDDTWESETMLRNGSADVLSDWYEWENKVHATIARVKSRCQYKGPEWRNVVKTKKGKGAGTGSKEGSAAPETGNGSDSRTGRRAAARPQRVRKGLQRFTGNGAANGQDGEEEVVRLDNGDGEGVTIAKEEVDMELPEMEV